MAPRLPLDRYRDHRRRARIGTSPQSLSASGQAVDTVFGDLCECPHQPKLDISGRGDQDSRSVIFIEKVTAEAKLASSFPDSLQEP